MDPASLSNKAVNNLIKNSNKALQNVSESMQEINTASAQPSSQINNKLNNKIANAQKTPEQINPETVLDAPVSNNKTNQPTQTNQPDQPTQTNQPNQRNQTNRSRNTPTNNRVNNRTPNNQRNNNQKNNNQRNINQRNNNQMNNNQMNNNQSQEENIADKSVNSIPIPNDVEEMLNQSVENALNPIENTIANTVNSPIIYNNTKNNSSSSKYMTTVRNTVMATLENDNTWTIMKVILLAVGIIVLATVIKYYYVKYKTDTSSSPWLVEGTKSAKTPMVISQSEMPLKRSDKGLQFTYSMWFIINDMDYKNNEWKHMFHKGNEKADPTIAPGVWIHPTQNLLRVYMNTMKNMKEYIDIDNIPIKKWIHMAIVIRDTDMEVYINGFLKTKYKLDGIPRQNGEDVWININGGFDGYISKMRYYNYGLTAIEIVNMIRDGPSQESCVDTDEVPPYLDSSWWL